MISKERDLGIYLHIPFCRQKCSYCDFPSYEGLQEYYASYVEALKGEIRLWCAAHPESRTLPVDTVYFGGGTPTELSIDQLADIMKTIQETFMLKDTVQISVESNPGEVDRSFLTELHRLGMNRISFGVQTFTDKLLKLLRRSHTSGQAITALEEASRAGFTDISADFIYALPEQTMADLKDTMNRLRQLPVNHVSIYGLQLEGGTWLEQQVSRGTVILPDEDTAESMYDFILDNMEEAGYERYEISNFAAHKSYSRHNLRYWQYKDYLGFGSGAHSFYEGVRRASESYVVPYCERIKRGELPITEEVVITPARAMEDYSFLALRTRWGISGEDFQTRFDLPLAEKYGAILTELTKKGLIIYEESTDSWHLTRVGAKYGNYVFGQFIED